MEGADGFGWLVVVGVSGGEEIVKEKSSFEWRERCMHFIRERVPWLRIDNDKRPCVAGGRP